MILSMDSYTHTMVVQIELHNHTCMGLTHIRHDLQDQKLYHYVMHVIVLSQLSNPLS